jgi:hypothetical protein
VPTTASIVLIDDDEQLLDQFSGRLAGRLDPDRVQIKSWVPRTDDNPLEQLDILVAADTALVVTDYDLTGSGLTGLFGSSIVGWCQARAVPVGDFSRGNPGSLPTVPNLFELRVPTDLDAAVAYTVSTAYGFMDLKAQLADNQQLRERGTPAEILAVLLGRPTLESQLALYMSRISSANSSLIDRVQRRDETDAASKADLLAYVIGHVLTNAILRYPGPILSIQALAAYLATTPDEVGQQLGLFADARYGGPFAGDSDFYWRSEVDDVLERFAESISGDDVETVGEYNRNLFAAGIGHPAPKHGCDRCGGRNGGYLCPLTERPVCQRSDCSVSANSWIPAGADLCRIERDFYDEWAPLLGL